MFKFIFFYFALMPLVVQSQHRMDTLYAADIALLEKATDIYVLPHPRYSIDHFVIMRERDGTDRMSHRNKGDDLDDEGKLFLRDFVKGDRLIIRKVAAINKDAPERGWVKLKAMEWLVQ